MIARLGLAFLVAAFHLQTTLGAWHPAIPATGSNEGFGVNIHFTDPLPGELEMIAAAGFKWVRMDLTWARTERKPGEYDFSAYDRLIAGLEKNDLRALFILDYGNPLYAEPGDRSPFTSRAHTPEFRDAYAKWAAAAISHFKGRGIIWEFWNEPNLEGFWKPKPDVAAYIALVRRTVEELTGAGLIGKDNPKGQCLIGAATSGIDLTFLEECFKAGLLEHWDAVSVHPYRQLAPDTAQPEYEKLQRLIAKYAPAGKEIPVLSGEWGYSTAAQFLGKDETERERQQAKYLVRQFLTNQRSGVPLSIWYDWRDDGDNPADHEHRFGIVRRPYRKNQEPVFEPKPAYLAAKAFLTSGIGQWLEGAGAGLQRGVRGIVPASIWNKAPKASPDGDAKVEATYEVTMTPAPSPSPGGGETLKLSYRMADGWKFIRVHGQGAIPPLKTPDAEQLQPTALGLWVYGDGQGCTLRLRFTDATGQVFQPAGETVNWKGWRYITLNLKPQLDDPLTSWGGANDKAIHYPIHWDTSLLLDGNRKAVAGEICASSPVLIY